MVYLKRQDGRFPPHGSGTLYTILYITKEESHYVVKAWYHFRQELAKEVSLAVWHKDGHIKDILAQIASRPDFILIHMPSLYRAPHIDGLASAAIPVGIYIEDVHQSPTYISRFALVNHVTYVFCPYRDIFHQLLPDLASRFVWLPHSIEPTIFKDYGLQKSIELLLMGYVHYRAYPFRAAVLSTCNGRPGFVYHAHPGYKNCDENDPSFYTGEKYAQELNRAKILVTCGGRWSFPVLKYFEAPACGTAVMAPGGPDFPELGFLDADTFIECDTSNFKEKLAYYLRHEQELAQIARRGHDLVLTRHTVQVRVQELLTHLSRLL